MESILESSALHCNKLVLISLQLCYFLTFHFTISTHTDSIYIYLDSIKPSTHDSDQSFIMKLAKSVQLNCSKVLFILLLNWLASLPYLAPQVSTQYPCAHHGLYLEPLWPCPWCIPLPEFFLNSSGLTNDQQFYDYLLGSNTQGDSWVLAHSVINQYVPWCTAVASCFK